MSLENTVAALNDTMSHMAAAFSDSETYIALALAVLPVILLAIIVYYQDKYQREPVGKLLKAFFFGVLSVLPTIVLENNLASFTPPMPVVNGAYTAFVVAGCSEELCKLLLLILAIWKSPEFDEYFDGIVYSCFVALGFACCENIGYVFDQPVFEDALATSIVRALLSVPGHFLFGVMMGYYIALAKFNPEHRVRYLFLAFFVPMLLHGTFDSLLMIPDSMASGGEIARVILFVVLIWFDVKMWKWGCRRIKRLQLLSQQQNFDRNHPFDGFTWDF